MALRFSKGLRDALLDGRAAATDLMTATTISFGDGTGTDGNDEILDSANGLSGFSEGDNITVAGSTSNNVTAEILLVSAGSIEVAAGTLSTEAAGDQVILASARGASFADLFRNGTLHIYSGAQPSTPDDAETGTKLVEITLASGAFTPGADANGINFGNVSSQVLAKETGETWSGVAIASGTAGWFRFYANDRTTGASNTAVRFDGSIATTGAQLNMSNTAVALGGTTTIDSVAISLPMS